MGTKIIEFSELPEVLKQIGENVQAWADKTKVSTPRKAGVYFIKVAKRLAPRLSGDLRRSIKGHKEGKSYVVQSDVRDKTTSNFPYNLWVNGNIPSVRIGTKTYKYSNVQKTGIRGGQFWNMARNKTTLYMKDITIKDLTKLELVKS